MNNTIDQLKVLKDLKALKELIIKHETIDNVLIKCGNVYDVVSCSVVDFDAVDQKYLFYVEGYSCSFEIEDIDNWRLVENCF